MVGRSQLRHRGVNGKAGEDGAASKRGIRPTVNALATIMVSFILVSVLIW